MILTASKLYSEGYFSPFPLLPYPPPSVKVEDEQVEQSLPLLVEFP